MGAKFFVGWQTWQMLSFVLAMAIVCVFIFGFARLWYTNRKIERLELIDEERRVRLAEMRHCGIPAQTVNDIPFGVRAIQSGIEVEGIWISRPNTPDASKRASAATLVSGSGESTNKGKGKAVDTSFEAPRRLHNMSFAGSSDQTLGSSPLVRNEVITSSYPVQELSDESDPYGHAARTMNRTSRPNSLTSGVPRTDFYYDVEATGRHQLVDAPYHYEHDHGHGHGHGHELELELEQDVQHLHQYQQQQQQHQYHQPQHQYQYQYQYQPQPQHQSPSQHQHQYQPQPQHWETSSQHSQPYDSRSSSDGDVEHAHQSRSGYAPLQREQNPYSR